MLADVGLETDECLFSAALYPPIDTEFTIRVFRHQIPLMLMSYVGAAKAWLYAPILAVIPPTAFLVRFISLLIGVCTLLFFYKFVQKIFGNAPAIAALVFLSTDPIYLLTTKWDWGPVAIQHLCLISSCYFLIRHYETRAIRYLAAGFLLLGIGLWDKALFCWSIVGLTIAAVTVCPREIRTVISRKAIAFALMAFILGTLPLLAYNLKHSFATIRSNVHWSVDGLAGKADTVRMSLEGSALYGGITRGPGDGRIHQATTIIQDAIVWLDKAVGSPLKGLQWYAFLLGIAATPFLPRCERRIVTFALLFLIVAWSMMALTKNAGVSVHHTALLWPMPQIVMASLVALAVRRFYRFGVLAAVALVTAIAIGNLLVLNTYYADEIRNGATVAWTDAFDSFSLDLSVRHPDAVYLLDWGFADNLRLLHKGKIDLRIFSKPKTSEERTFATAELRNGNLIYVTHTPGNIFFESDVKDFMTFVDEEGYRKDVLRTFSDRNGRPVIELFRLVRVPK